MPCSNYKQFFNDNYLDDHKMISDPNNNFVCPDLEFMNNIGGEFVKPLYVIEEGSKQ